MSSNRFVTWPPSGDIIKDMTIVDLPDDARLFKSREVDGFISSVLIAVTSSRHWEFKSDNWNTKDCTWRSWTTPSLVYALNHGIEITRREAEDIEAPLLGEHSLLRLQEGL